MEVSEAADAVYEVVDPNANIIFGAVIDERLQGELRITVIATGFNGALRRGGGERIRSESAPLTSSAQTGDDFLDIPEFLRKRKPL
jgi:cell division protein FtsZ